MARSVKERLAHIKEQIALIEQIDLAFLSIANDLDEAKALARETRDKIKQVLAGKTVYDTSEDETDASVSNSTSD